eukprot:TRINITY_DN16771_c0_g1_i1.p1 TRINITY_DN16771_c0_g1~~TRINITY_DN16771_c0_g1_i1.p1  ORF type:complete len:434 (+),score=116.98 TRINITY_DN16771_c0_g1_i1:75-1304(+)
MQQQGEPLAEAPSTPPRRVRHSPPPSPPPRPPGSAADLAADRAALQLELRAAQGPESAPLLRSLLNAQRFLESFRYSLDGPSFRARKSRPLRDILRLGAAIIRARDEAPIQCIEGAFVGLYLTQGLRGVTRFGVSVESALPCGRRYYHQLLGLRVDCPHSGAPLFGAFGHSRDFGLACKPPAFASLAQLLRNYLVHYRRAGHVPVSCRVGRPICGAPWRGGTAPEPQFAAVPVWVQEGWDFADPEWPAAAASFQGRLAGRERWPPPSAEPYRREPEAPAEAAALQGEPPAKRRRLGPPLLLGSRPRAATPPPPTRGGPGTPPQSAIGRSAADSSAPDEYVRRVRLGHFSARPTGRLTLGAAAAHAATLGAFARCKAAALRLRAAAGPTAGSPGTQNRKRRREGGDSGGT